MNFSEIWPLFIISVNKKSTPASLLLKIKIHYSDKKNQNRRTIKNDDFKFWLLEFFFTEKWIIFPQSKYLKFESKGKKR